MFLNRHKGPLRMLIGTGTATRKAPVSVIINFRSRRHIIEVFQLSPLLLFVLLNFRKSDKTVVSKTTATCSH